MAALRLAVFDCDGVLFDSREANRRYYDHLRRSFGHPPMTPAELEFVHTHDARLSTRHIFREWPREQDEAESYRAAVDYGPYLDYMVMEEGLIPFLTLLKRRVRTAISTNRTTTMANLMEKSGLAPYFEYVVTALDVANPKPHPEALFKILSHFELEAGEGIFIGDSEVDREHASSAGMRFIAYKNPSLEADYHGSSFEEVAGLPPFREIG